mgnify:CR=1 FL=1
MKTTKGQKMSNWIEWQGGECPVDGDIEVEIDLEDNGKYTGLANHYYWGTNEPRITRYRVVEAKEEAEPEKPLTKYQRRIKGIVVDVYDIGDAYGVTNQALSHLLKKVLCTGKRGHKDIETDLQDIIDSAVRAKQLEGF